jgi:multisubunit Na+/H+ antiporter MnhG subunit
MRFFVIVAILAGAAFVTSAMFAVLLVRDVWQRTKGD